MSQLPSDPSSSDLFAGEPAPMAPAPRPRKPDTSKIRDNLLLIVMPLVAAGVLYLLNQRGGPLPASAQQLQNELQVETAISTLSGRSSQTNKVKTQTILDNFYHEARQRQVPVDRVRGNPFVFKSPQPSTAPSPQSRPSEPTPTPEPVDTDRTAAMTAAKQLTLQSILTGSGSRSVASISNNLLTEGQVISGWTVAKITPTEVYLTWRDQKFVLKMKE